MKFIKVCSLFLATLILTACSSETKVIEVPTDSTRFNGVNADTIKVITDSETGCKYIFVEDGMGNYKTTAMSPLMENDSSVDCN